MPQGHHFAVGFAQPSQGRPQSCLLLCPVPAGANSSSVFGSCPSVMSIPLRQVPQSLANGYINSVLFGRGPNNNTGAKWSPRSKFRGRLIPFADAGKSLSLAAAPQQAIHDLA